MSFLHARRGSRGGSLRRPWIFTVLAVACTLSPRLLFLA